MGKDAFRGAVARRDGDTNFCISISRANGAEMRGRITALKLKGRSEFFQRLMSEARGAGLPIMGGGAK